MGGRARPIARGRVQVDLVAFVRRPLDDDNLTAGMKPLRDAVASTLGVDDGDPRIRFVVHQIPAGAGPEGTCIRITLLPDGRIGSERPNSRPPTSTSNTP